MSRESHRTPPSPPSSSSSQRSSRRGKKSKPSWFFSVRLFFLISIVVCVLGFFRMHFVTLRFHGDSNTNPILMAAGPGTDDYPSRQRTTARTQTSTTTSTTTTTRPRSEAESGIANEAIGVERLPPLHERVTDPVSKAWVIAIQQAEEMLAAGKTTTTTTTTTTTVDENGEDDKNDQGLPGSVSWNAACLVPNTRKTEELVRKLVSEKKKKQQQQQPPQEPHNNNNNNSNSNSNNQSTTTTTTQPTAFKDPLVPLPILNVGMPKLGSTSLYRYFKCKGLNATHWNMDTEEFEGLCMRDSVRVGLPPLSTCSNETQAIMQMDVAFPMGSAHDSVRIPTRSSAQRDDCFFPQLSLLEAFHDESPHSTLVLTFRPIADWTRSVTRWHSMMERLQQCHLPNLPRGVPDLGGLVTAGAGGSNHTRNRNHTLEVEAAMAQFFCSTVLHVRNFVEEHPTHALIELDLYDDQTPLFLDRLFPSDDNDDDNDTTNNFIPNGNDATTNIDAMNSANSTTTATTVSSCWSKHKGGHNGNRNAAKQRKRKPKAEKRKREKQKTDKARPP